MNIQKEAPVTLQHNSFDNMVVTVTDDDGSGIPPPPAYLYGLPLYYSDDCADHNTSETLKSFKGGKAILSDCPFFRNLKQLAEPVNHKTILCNIDIGQEGCKLIEAYAANTQRIVARAALYCLAHGLDFELRGSELDALLIDDPKKITNARKNLKVDQLRIMDNEKTQSQPNRLIESEKPADAKMRFDYPGQGGIDFKVKTRDEAVLSDLYTFLSMETELADPADIKYVVPDVGYPINYYALSGRHQLQEVLSLATIPEYPSMHTINHQLVVDQLAVRDGVLLTQPYALASLNISGEDDDDLRRTERCFNLDALKGQVILRDGQGNLVEADDVRLADINELTPFVNLPEIPLAAILPEEVYAYYLQQMEQGNSDKAAGCIEVMIRGMRKALTYDIPVDNVSALVCEVLVEKASQLWPPQNIQYLDKNATEIKVCAELDSHSTLLYLRFLGLYRLIPALNDEEWFSNNFHTIIYYYEELLKIYGIRITSANGKSVEIPNYLILSEAIRKVRYPDENPMESVEETLELR